MKTKESEKIMIIPPDPDRCQAEIREGSFLTLGPRSYHRCKNEPIAIVTEEPREDELPPGCMSLCPGCLEICLQQSPNVKVWRLQKNTR